jgi:hypothetical protein
MVSDRRRRVLDLRLHIVIDPDCGQQTIMIALENGQARLRWQFVAPHRMQLYSTQRRLSPVRPALGGGVTAQAICNVGT